MAILNEYLQAWLRTVPKEALIGVNEGGLILEEVGHPEVYCKIGGLPYDNERFDLREEE